MVKVNPEWKRTNHRFYATPVGVLPPCKKDGVPCDKRHVGCHSTCEGYQAYKAEADRIAKNRKAVEDSYR